MIRLRRLRLLFDRANPRNLNFKTLSFLIVVDCCYKFVIMAMRMNDLYDCTTRFQTGKRPPD
jgi:hypothetical protein